MESCADLYSLAIATFLHVVCVAERVTCMCVCAHTHQSCSRTMSELLGECEIFNDCMCRN